MEPEIAHRGLRGERQSERNTSPQPALLNVRWLHGETVLHFLAIEGFADGVGFLAARGTDVNAVNEFGDTALIDAASLGIAAIVDILLTHCALPDAGSRTRDNALHAAAKAGHIEVVRRLLVAGADATYRTELGETVFDAVASAPTSAQSERRAALAEHGARDPSAE